MNRSDRSRARAIAYAMPVAQRRTPALALVVAAGLATAIALYAVLSLIF